MVPEALTGEKYVRYWYTLPQSHFHYNKNAFHFPELFFDE